MFLLILLLVLMWFVPAPAASEMSMAAAQPANAVAPLEINGEPATDLAIEPVSGEARYAAAGTELFAADGSGGWTAAGFSPNLEKMIVDTRNPDVLWAGTSRECYRGGGISLSLMQSTDGGATWTETGPGGLVPLASWIDTGVVIAHDCSGLQVSFDSGASWMMPEGLPMGSQVTAFTVASSPESAAGLTLLVGVTSEGGTSNLYRVDLSDRDNVRVDGPLQTYYGFGSLEVEDTGAILLGAPQGVLRSDDGGESWTVLRSGLESTTLEQDPIESFPTDVEPGSFGLTSMLVANGQTYVSGIDGVYQRSESDESWTKVVDLDSEVEALAVEPGTGALLIEQDEGGVLRVLSE